jgi:hypothetical protein
MSVKVAIAALASYELATSTAAGNCLVRQEFSAVPFINYS